MLIVFSLKFTSASHPSVKVLFFERRTIASIDCPSIDSFRRQSTNSQFKRISISLFDIEFITSLYTLNAETPSFTNDSRVNDLLYFTIVEEDVLAGFARIQQRCDQGDTRTVDPEFEESLESAVTVDVVSVKDDLF